MANISNELRILRTLERGGYIADRKCDKSGWISQSKSHKKKTILAAMVPLRSLKGLISIFQKVLNLILEESSLKVNELYISFLL